MQPKQYTDCTVDTDQVTLRRPEEGKNVILTINGRHHEIGRIASAFPLSAAVEAVVFFDVVGEEIGVMKHVDALDAHSRRLLQLEMEQAYFMPRIEALLALEEALSVETWTVATDKGERSFEVRDPRNNVRTMGKSRVIIKDVDGNRYEVPNWRALDRHSIGLLLRYL